jgi:hypothetical protein
MRRLKQNQRVELHLDTADQAVPCRVASVQGAVATLTRIEELPPDVLAQFTPGALGYLLFEHRGNMVGLKGIATADSGEGSELAFVVIDGVQLPERRSGERVHIGARARVAPAGGDAAAGIETAATNVSVGGVLIERPAGLGGGPFRLEIVLDGDDAPIRCEAATVRQTSTHIAMKFTDIEDADRVRLAGVIRRQAHGIA